MQMNGYISINLLNNIQYYSFIRLSIWINCLNCLCKNLILSLESYLKLYRFILNFRNLFIFIKLENIITFNLLCYAILYYNSILVYLLFFSGL
jgi:hypothetical protein